LVFCLATDHQRPLLLFITLKERDILNTRRTLVWHTQPAATTFWGTVPRSGYITSYLYTQGSLGEWFIPVKFKNTLRTCRRNEPPTDTLKQANYIQIGTSSKPKVAGTNLDFTKGAPHALVSPNYWILWLYKTRLIIISIKINLFSPSYS
jgi:hypothetical protein